ncbi:MAG TPA: MFS transporter [Candidatus Kapabacteria bacterium]|nr:MFS transporter [Candidatus Kapabacteria bacterium]
MQHRTASRGEIFSWTLFDFANTGFYVIIISLLYSTFFTDVIANGNASYWGRTISASMLLTAIVGPLLGSISDATHRKKRFLALFTGLCVAATALLSFTGPGMLMMAAALVILANVGFEGGTIFYDAFLPDIAAEQDYNRVSGYGFAMGYLGSFVILMIVLPLVTPAALPPVAQSSPAVALAGLSARGAVGYAAALPSLRLTDLIAAAFFALFSLPLFLFVRERQTPRAIAGNPLAAGYRRLRETFAHIRSYDAVKRFLLAFFVYNDSILTVILFAGIFAKESLKMETAQLIYFFMIVQGSALIGSLIFGALGNRIGARQSIIITIVIWIGVVVGAYFITTAGSFFILGAVAGIALGSSQSCSRSLMALLTPDEKRTEFFGFYDGFFGKASAVVGPLVFGEVADWLGLRQAMLVIGVIFVLGILLLLRVPDARVMEPAAAA